MKVVLQRRRWRLRPGGARGIVSIEAAIYLGVIAIVGVTVTFALLGNAMLAAEGGRSSADAGVDEATNTLVIRGGVIAISGPVDTTGNGTADDEAVVQLRFIVQTAVREGVANLQPAWEENGSGVDPAPLGTTPRALVSYIDDRVSISSAAWTVEFLGDGDGHLLTGPRRAEVTVWLHPYDHGDDVWTLGGGPGDPFIDSAADLVKARQRLEVQLKTTSGAVLTIERSIPARLDPSMHLD